MKQILLFITATMLCSAVYAQQHKAKSGRKKPVRKQTVTTPPPKVPVSATPDAIEPAREQTVSPGSAPQVYQDARYVEKMPEFKGGHQGLMHYLGSNLQYPEQAIDSDIQGQVVVSFTVCEDGSLCDEKIMRSLGGGCDEEALRVIKKMPRWEPGTKDGKPVKVRYVLPVRFQLQE